MEKIKRLPDAEFEIIKVVWTNEPPVTATNLMVIRDEHRNTMPRKGRICFTRPSQRHSRPIQDSR